MLDLIFQRIMETDINGIYPHKCGHLCFCQAISMGFWIYLVNSWAGFCVLLLLVNFSKPQTSDFSSGPYHHVLSMGFGILEGFFQCFCSTLSFQQAWHTCVTGNLSWWASLSLSSRLLLPYTLVKALVGREGVFGSPVAASVLYRPYTPGCQRGN